jgi:hypothetical protein
MWHGSRGRGRGRLLLVLMNRHGKPDDRRRRHHCPASYAFICCGLFRNMYYMMLGRRAPPRPLGAPHPHTLNANAQPDRCPEAPLAEHQSAERAKPADTSTNDTSLTGSWFTPLPKPIRAWPARAKSRLRSCGGRGGGGGGREKDL